MDISRELSKVIDQNPIRTTATPTPGTSSTSGMRPQVQTEAHTNPVGPPTILRPGITDTAAAPPPASADVQM
eukprot:6594180-Pyramimonas_sp.AAC.1